MSRDSYNLPIAFVCGSLLGLTLGAVLGVLFAPAKGRLTRRQLARKAEELGDRATEMTETARKAAKEIGRRIA